MSQRSGSGGCAFGDIVSFMIGRFIVDGRSHCRLVDGFVQQGSAWWNLD